MDLLLKFKMVLFFYYHCLLLNYACLLFCYNSTIAPVLAILGITCYLDVQDVQAACTPYTYAMSEGCKPEFWKGGVRGL
jgi:hypothetical protein